MAQSNAESVLPATTLEKAKQQVLTLIATKSALLDQEKQFLEEVLEKRHRRK